MVGRDQLLNSLRNYYLAVEVEEVCRHLTGQVEVVAVVVDLAVVVGVCSTLVGTESDIIDNLE